jgi:hypothetical protein
MQELRQEQLVSAVLLFLLKMTRLKPNAISEYFEMRFARLEYAGGEKFNTAYMRYAGQWWEIFWENGWTAKRQQLRSEP